MSKKLMKLGMLLGVVAAIAITTQIAIGSGDPQACGDELRDCLNIARADLSDCDPSGDNYQWNLEGCINIAIAGAAGGVGPDFLEKRIQKCIRDAVEDYEEHFDPDCWDDYMDDAHDCASQFVLCAYGTLDPSGPDSGGHPGFNF